MSELCLSCRCGQQVDRIQVTELSSLLVSMMHGDQLWQFSRKKLSELCVLGAGEYPPYPTCFMYPAISYVVQSPVSDNLVYPTIFLIIQSPVSVWSSDAVLWRTPLVDAVGMCSYFHCSAQR